MTASAPVVVLPPVSRPRRQRKFPRYRVYTTENRFCSIHKSFTTLQSAMKCAEKVSLEDTYAEVRDDTLKMSERLLAVYKQGNLLGTTFQPTH